MNEMFDGEIDVRSLKYQTEQFLLKASYVLAVAELTFDNFSSVFEIIVSKDSR